MSVLRSILGRELPPRVAIVSAELRRFSRPRYLEIGVDTGVLFLHVRAHRKVGVDPVARVPRWKWLVHPNTLLRGSFFRSTSEGFFRALERAGPADAARYEVIFIDGDHSFSQSLRDVDNALRHLADGGVTLVHDCNPPTAAAASPDSSEPGGGPWCGEAWKTIVHLRASRDDLAVETLDTDFGVGVIRRGRGERLDLDPDAIRAMSYADLEADRERLLGLRAWPG